MPARKLAATKEEKKIAEYQQKLERTEEEGNSKRKKVLICTQTTKRFNG